jgi:low affinity Fe/Cu permease
MGSYWAFIIAIMLIVVWAFSGPAFGYSDTWELIINTATTIITFLMVFLIQNTQNRDARALHLKIDELIMALRHADNKMLNIENLSIEELEELAKKYQNASEHVTRTRDAKKKSHHNHNHDKNRGGGQ